MLKLGDYDEDGSKAVAECLKKAGVRVELKPSIGASLETEDLLQGRLSELKAIIKDKELLEEYDGYLDALRKILAQKVSPEDFEKEYLAELFPTMDEKRKALSDLIDRALGDGKDEAEHGGSAGALMQNAQPRVRPSGKPLIRLLNRLEGMQFLRRNRLLPRVLRITHACPTWRRMLMSLILRPKRRYQPLSSSLPRAPGRKFLPDRSFS